MRVASYFNIETKILEPNDKELKRIFKVRNQITHELDVDMDSKTFALRERNLKEAQGFSKHLLDLSEKFIELVSKMLSEKEEIDEEKQLDI